MENINNNTQEDTIIIKRGIKQCDYCGKEIKDNSTYCSYCGKEIKKCCQNCGNKIEKGEKFCSNCGNPINNESNNTNKYIEEKLKNIIPNPIIRNIIAIFIKFIVLLIISFAISFVLYYKDPTEFMPCLITAIILYLLVPIIFKLSPQKRLKFELILVVIVSIIAICFVIGKHLL